jgi:hypothetical protein
VLVGWSAARLERRGRIWKSARELAVNPDRWAVATRCERGYTKVLPDLVGWFDPSGRPIAVVAESGGRRDDRQKWILEGWREAILHNRYGGVRYDCATDSVAQWISRLAKKVHLTGPAIAVAVQPGPDEIVALSAVPDEPRDAAGEPTPKVNPQPTQTVAIRDASPAAAAPPAHVRVETPGPRPREPETPEAAAERMRIYREVMGIPEEKPRRRWRR